MNTLLKLDERWLISWNRLAQTNSLVETLVKWTAEYVVYLVPLFFVVLWFYSTQAKKVALRALFSVGLGLGLATFLGQIIDRPRPFEAGAVKEILFHRPDYSFPSDHATLFFAIALSFYLSGYKKLGIFCFILAILVSVARIASGVHFPSDILGGAVVGMLCAFIIYLFDRPLGYVYALAINLSRKLKLA